MLITQSEHSRSLRTVDAMRLGLKKCPNAKELNTGPLTIVATHWPKGEWKPVDKLRPAELRQIFDAVKKHQPLFRQSGKAAGTAGAGAGAGTTGTAEAGAAAGAAAQVGAREIKQGRHHAQGHATHAQATDTALVQAGPTVGAVPVPALATNSVLQATDLQSLVHAAAGTSAAAGPVVPRPR